MVLCGEELLGGGLAEDEAEGCDRVFGVAAKGLPEGRVRAAFGGAGFPL